MCMALLLCSQSRMTKDGWRLQNKTNEKRQQDAVGDGRLRPQCRHLETYVSSVTLAYSIHYVKTWRHPQNRKFCT